MQDLLYESRGGSKKRTTLLGICACLIIACGMGLLLFWVYMPEYVAIRKAIPFMGLAAIVGGVYIAWYADKKDFVSRAFLLIYQDHVEGLQVAPDKAFSLRYEEIYNVRKAVVLLNEFLIIETADGQINVQVSDVQSAYQLISRKLDELEAV